jgi:multiple sugar transport system permease protein
VLVVLAVFVYPLLDGVRASLHFYRLRPLARVRRVGELRERAGQRALPRVALITLRFVGLAVAVETALGLALALLCAREVPFVRVARTLLIVPMIVTPVVVGIVFRLIYASDVGLLTAVSRSLGGEGVQVLSREGTAFLGLVALDVWEWTPLMFLVLLAGLQSLPVEPWRPRARTARARGGSSWTTRCPCWPWPSCCARSTPSPPSTRSSL